MWSTKATLQLLDEIKICGRRQHSAADISPLSHQNLHERDLLPQSPGSMSACSSYVPVPGELVTLEFRMLQDGYPICSCSDSFGRLVGRQPLDMRLLDWVIREDEEAFIVCSQTVVHQWVDDGKEEAECSVAARFRPFQMGPLVEEIRAKATLSMQHNERSADASAWTIRATLDNISKVKWRPKVGASQCGVRRRTIADDEGEGASSLRRRQLELLPGAVPE